jgi:hypothetical protein
MQTYDVFPSKKNLKIVKNYKIKNRVLTLEVPMDVSTRSEKDNIILSTITTLEQSINIKNK